MLFIYTYNETFKNEPSEVCGRQPLKKFQICLKWFISFKESLILFLFIKSSLLIFGWSIKISGALLIGTDFLFLHIYLHYLVYLQVSFLLHLQTMINLFFLQCKFPKVDALRARNFVHFKRCPVWRGFACFGQKHGKILPQKPQTF